MNAKKAKALRKYLREKKDLAEGGLIRRGSDTSNKKNFQIIHRPNSGRAIYQHMKGQHGN